jgi:hypothetical protein
MPSQALFKSLPRVFSTKSSGRHANDRYFWISLYTTTFPFMQAYPYRILQEDLSKFSTFQELLRFYGMIDVE